MAKGVVGGGRSTPATPSYHLSFLLLLSLSLLVLSPPILSPVRGDHHGDGDRDRRGDGRIDQELVEKKQGPDPAERAIGITGLTSRWDAIKTWAKLASMNLRPPESWYRRRGSSAGEVMKEAATRSFETGKKTVEHTAESAAKVAEETVHKTKEKVKRTVSGPDGNLDAEL